jgi:hypothetical protein
MSVHDSFNVLAELVCQEPTVLGCLNILQSTCLAQGQKPNPTPNITFKLLTPNMTFGAGIDCTIKGVRASEEFAEFISIHYTSFCENAIRSMYMCGFVPWRLRKIPGGDIVPEVLPVGSYTWQIVPNPIQSTSREGGSSSDGKTSGNVKKRETPYDRQHRVMRRQRNPLSVNDTTVLSYKMQINSNIPLMECDVEIYEYIQPQNNISMSAVLEATVPSPLSHVIVDYRILRESQQSHAFADSWNTRAKLLCTHVPQVDHQKINEGNPIVAGWGQEYNPRDAFDTGPTDLEFDLDFRDQVINNSVNSKDALHVPIVYTMPSNTDLKPVQHLAPCQEIESLHQRMAKNISSIMGIPFEMIGGGYAQGTGSKKSVENTRIFATNMLNLCKHLQELLRNVYVASYGGMQSDVLFAMHPSPRICVENVSELVLLLQTGVISRAEAGEISNMLLGVELKQQGISHTKDSMKMFRTPEQELAERQHAHSARIGSKNLDQPTTKTEPVPDAQVLPKPRAATLNPPPLPKADVQKDTTLKKTS